MVCTFSTLLEAAFVVFVLFESRWLWLSVKPSTGPEMFFMIFKISSIEIMIIMIVNKHMSSVYAHDHDADDDNPFLDALASLDLKLSVTEWVSH